MGKIVMGYWDCPICGNKEIRGDVTSCPSCGRARGDVQFYLKGYAEGETVSVDAAENMDAVSKEEAEALGDSPDWYCSFCNSLNSDNADTCGNCGASRADSEANYFDMLQKKKEKEAAELAAQPHTAALRKSNRSRLFIIIAAVVLAIVGLVVWLNARKTGDWEVTGLNWVRNVQVEENRLVDESSWSTYPSDAEQVTSRKEIRTYTQQPAGSHEETYYVDVYDHDEIVGYDQRDTGTGGIELVPITERVYRKEARTRTVIDYVSVPVWDTRYYYKVWRWMPSRTASASGSDHETAWPQLNLAENEREAKDNSRSEVYRITVRSARDANDVATWRLDEANWMKISTGEVIRISVKNSGGGAYICDADGNKIADLLPDK